MGSLNQWIGIGNLGRDAELRYTQGGTAVANFNMACTDTWYDRDNQKQERTEWVRVVVWGKTAEALQEYLTKGKQVSVVGSLQTREWQDKDGNKRYTTEVKAHRVVLLGGGGNAGGGGRRRSRSTNDEYDDPVDDSSVDDGSRAPIEPVIDDSDIPF